MKRGNIFVWKQELKMCIMIFVMTILTYCLVIKIWNWDLRVPFGYYAGGDIAGILSIIKNYINGEHLGNVLSMSAPFGTNRLRSLFDASFNHGIIWIIAKITKDVGYTINVFYILTFGLSAVCAYILLRKLNIRTFSSFVGGMIYAFIPGAILRGESHIFVGSIFIIPLSVLVIIRFMRGEFCKREFQVVDKLTLKETVQSVDKKMVFGIVIMTLLSFSTLYYGVFAMILLTFALLYVCLERKQMRHIYYYFLLVVSQFLTWGLIFIPQFLNSRIDETYRPVSMVSRAMSEVETYGLKLAQLFLPISNHRISLLAEIRRIYDTNFLGINENGMATLGATMTLGAIIGVLCVFYNLFRANEMIILSGKMILFSIIVAVVGGLASFIGMLTYSIRCYNRFSFYIGCFSVIIIATILDMSIQKLLASVRKNHVRQVIYIALGAILVTGAVLDQTPNNVAYNEETSIQLSAKYYANKKFVEEIEKLEGGEAMVLVLPMETMFGYTNEGRYINYETNFLYLHSQSSSWSTGGHPGEEGWRWLRSLVNNKWENIFTNAAVMGYTGIAMYMEGFSVEEQLTVRQTIENMIGKADIIHEGASWEYYSLDVYAEKLKTVFSDEEFNVLEEYCGQVPSEFYGNELYCSDPVWSENQYSILVKQDAVQHGPYTSLDEGKYIVTIQGKNLQNGDFYINLDNGLEQKDVEIQEITEEQVTYIINLQNHKDAVEFCCKNIDEEVIVIDCISVRPYTEEYIEGYKLMERIMDNVQ